MGSLVKFELKKIVSRRTAQVAVAVIAILLALAAGQTISSQYALVPARINVDAGGTEAIAQQKANANALAGPITDEKATELLREFKTFIGPDGEIRDRYRWENPTKTDDMKRYWSFYAENGKLLSLLCGPWMSGFEMPVSVAARIDTSRTVDLYGQVRAKDTSVLAAPQGTFTYSEAEQEFWKSKADSVKTPVEYGYAGGWKEFLNMAQFLIFALIAVVIACAPVFNTEYRDKTDAVLLSTKLGKSQLGRAKVIAALIVASAIYLIITAVMLGIMLIFYGPDGAGLPLQVRNLCLVYDMSIAQAALCVCAIGYVVMLGLLGVVLALSARMRSSMGILAIAAALVLVPMFVSNLQNDLANHLLYLAPFFALDPGNLFDMVSYAFGPLVLEYPVALTLVYLIVFAGGTVFAARSFSRHQVA